MSSKANLQETSCFSDIAAEFDGWDDEDTLPEQIKKYRIITLPQRQLCILGNLQTVPPFNSLTVPHAVQYTIIAPQTENYINIPSQQKDTQASYQQDPAYANGIPSKPLSIKPLRLITQFDNLPQYDSEPSIPTSRSDMYVQTDYTFSEDEDSQQYILDTEESDAGTGGFDQSRFTEEIEEFFHCDYCAKIVRSPVECQKCQSLSCKYCVSQVYICNDCGKKHVSRQPSRYAALVYSRFRLKCENYGNGCKEVGPIHDIVEHEADCMYIVKECSNVICNNTFIKAARFKGEQYPLVCSDLCLKLVKLRHKLKKGSKMEQMQVFSKLLCEAKALVEQQVRDENEGLAIRSAEVRQEAVALRLNHKRLTVEVEKRRKMYHIGKWNGVRQMWTCCGDDDKYAIGCRER